MLAEAHSGGPLPHVLNTITCSAAGKILGPPADSDSNDPTNILSQALEIENCAILLRLRF
jgi:hypothetical protein